MPLCTGFLTHAHTHTKEEWMKWPGKRLTAFCPCAETSACHSVFYSLQPDSTVNSHHNIWYWGGEETAHHFPFGLFRVWQRRLEVKILYFLPCQNWKWLECCSERGMYIVLVIRPSRIEMRLTPCQTLRCFLSFVSPPPPIWNSIWYISVPNGGSAIDINYLSITVCDTINLLSAGSTNDWN